jgi:HK97 family phage prohead protease
MVNTVEVRSAGDGTVNIELYASITEQWYDMVSYEEIVRAGSFRRTLNQPNLDCILTIEHAGLALASTVPVNGAPTLELSEDSTGLRAQATLSEDDPDVKMLLVKSRQAPLETSFRFLITSQKYDSNYEKREITGASLDRGDISVVGRAANPSTQGTVQFARGAAGLQERKRQAELMGRHWHGGAHLFSGDTPRSNRTPALPTYALDIDAELRRIKALRSRRPAWGNRATVENDVPEEKTCPTCTGTGTIREGHRKCPTCLGRGKVKPGKARARDWDAESRRQMAELQEALRR